MFCNLDSFRYYANFALTNSKGVLAHLVERNTGSVEVSGSSPLCSTPSACSNAGVYDIKKRTCVANPFFLVWTFRKETVPIDSNYSQPASFFMAQFKF